MRFRLILPIAVLLAVLAAPAAQAKIRVGLSEQSPALFDQPSWQQLKLKRVRYILPWDYYKSPNQHFEVATFMNAARAHKQEVLVTFAARRGCYTGRYSRRKACRAPSVSTYKKMVKRFRTEFPYAKLFTTWNEANHVSQPTYRKPKLAARYFLALRSACRRCTIMAADVLDSSDASRYLGAFQRAAHRKGRLWGLHNYKDVNRRHSSGVKAVMRAVRGSVWLTETGGIVKFGKSFRYSEKRAASRTKYMFALTRRYKRLKRIYVYRWFGEPRSSRFDAGLVDPDGSARPALKVFRKSIRGLPR